MRDTSISKSKALWAGLNFPTEEWNKGDIVVFGIPFDGGASVRKGASAGPNAIRGITTSITPTTEEFKSFENLVVVDVGNFVGQSQEQIFNEVEEFVSKLVKEKKFFTMLGGDHSVTIPVLKGINRGIDADFGIIHIDAHFDLNDSLCGSKFSHGCPARRGSELDRVHGSENIFFIGIRSIENDEIKFLKNNIVHVVSAKELAKIGPVEVISRVKRIMGMKKYIYVTIDIDCLDPAYAAGTGTPQFGGMTARELLTILEGIFSLNVIGFDVVEVAPDLDPSLTAVYGARKIITECWGYKFLNKR